MKVDPKTRIPPHLDYRTMESDDRNRKTKIEPEVLGPDYRAADDPGYYKEDNVSNDEVTYTDVSEYSIVDYPIIGKRKRKKKRRRKRGMPTSGGAYRSEVGCFECFVMIFCPWRWVSSR
ncbi:uncharacterized protein LOC134817966 [Bolinopsis microptera]|uniref:uncharacterized protein LOC134817966 n=1 Tax=Bolinopsis microptera TaxID=2820187 RepID=UPI003078A7D0